MFIVDVNYLCNAKESKADCDITLSLESTCDATCMV